MVCSNEMLKASLDDLKTVVKENTAEQKETRSSLDSLTATFTTWQVTMCKDHHDKLQVLDDNQREQETTINRTIGKAVGIVAAVMLLMQGFGLYFAYLKIAPKLIGG